MSQSLMRLFEYLSENGILPRLFAPVVELGCNDGRILMPFYKIGYVVIGVDQDVSAILQARKAMPKATFYVSDIRTFVVPEGSFIILRNVLPFLASKEEVMDLLRRHSAHPMHFTLFGEEDERPKDCLWWTREEVEAICKELGAILVEEFNGTGTNMAGKPRRTHNFYCLKL